MRTCAKCGKSGSRLWLTKSGLCEECAMAAKSEREQKIVEGPILPTPILSATAIKKPIHKRFWFWGLSALVAAILINAMIGGFFRAEKEEIPIEDRLFVYAKYVVGEFAESAEFGDKEDAAHYYDEDQDVHRVQAEFLTDGSGGVKERHRFTISIKIDSETGDYGTIKLLIDGEQLYP